MPAVTPVDSSVLPVLEESEGTPRRVQSIVAAQASFEGAGFPVHRPFPQPGADQVATDPFLMLDKLVPPRYQDLNGEKLTLARSADEKALVRLIAGEVGGQSGPGSTHTPIVYAHATIDAGGRLSLAWPSDYNALVYVLRGSVRVG